VASAFSELRGPWRRASRCGQIYILLDERRT